MQVLRIMEDEEGNPFPSGYYFLFITTDDGSKAVPYSGRFFHVNPRDADKVEKRSAAI